MRSTLAGFGGLLFLPPFELKQEVKLVESKGKERKIVYRTLGKTGLKLPVINMGVMNSDNPQLIRAALDSGMVMLDTAHGYMGGRNEETIGQVIKDRPRDSFVIATKVSLPQDRSTGLYTEGATTKEFLRKLDLSLKRLGVDHVEILYHHNVSRRESVIYEPVLNGLEKAKKDGKIRFAGISTHSNEPEVMQAAVESKCYEVIQTAYNYHQRHYKEVRLAIAKAAEAGLGIVTMKAIRGGFRLLPSAKNPAASLKWVLQDPNVHTVIPGFTTFEELEVDLAVMEDLRLTEEEKRALQKEAALPSHYCQGCRRCSGTCPEHLPIPDLMRAYMYTYDYRNVERAREVVASLDLPDKVCEDCSVCQVRCASNFNVSKKIREVVRLRDAFV
ncbi:MAG: aldo/keto reductase [Desulfobacterota bacterium]|nr:aldo/keto reductase [Thermodesulfobacteriota bacterium]